MPTLLNFQAADASGKMFTVRPNVLGLFPLRSSGGWNNRRSAVRDQRSPQSLSILSLSPLFRHFFFPTPRSMIDSLPRGFFSDWWHRASTDRPTFGDFCRLRKWFFFASPTGTAWLSLMGSRLGSARPSQVSARRPELVRVPLTSDSSILNKDGLRASTDDKRTPSTSPRSSSLTAALCSFPASAG